MKYTHCTKQSTWSTSALVNSGKCLVLTKNKDTTVVILQQTSSRYVVSSHVRWQQTSSRYAKQCCWFTPCARHNERSRRRVDGTIVYNRGAPTSLESHYIASQAVESITISANVRLSMCTREKTRAAVDWVLLGRASNNAGSISRSPPSPSMPQSPSHSTATLKEQSIRHVPAEAEAGSTV